MSLVFTNKGQRGCCALEVKNTARVEHRSLKAFKEDYPEAQLALLYIGEDHLMVDGILCVPCQDFLQALPPNQPFIQNTKAPRL